MDPPEADSNRFILIAASDDIRYRNHKYAPIMRMRKDAVNPVDL